MAEVAAEPQPRRRCWWAAILGCVLVGLALLDFGFWIVMALQSGSWRVLAAGEVWYRIDVSSLNLVQAVIQRYIYPPLWDPFLVSVLQWPFWALLGIPGIALVAIFGRRKTD